MSGFRKFRSSLHRRRRTIEAAELGHLQVAPRTITGLAPAQGGPREGLLRGQGNEADAAPLEFSPSREAREIGPAPIAWLRGRKAGLDH
jgi:hypothetical protein